MAELLHLTSTVFPVSKQFLRPAEAGRASSSDSASSCAFQAGQCRLTAAGDGAPCTPLYPTRKGRYAHLKQAAETLNPVDCSLPFLLSTLSALTSRLCTGK